MPLVGTVALTSVSLRKEICMKYPFPVGNALADGIQFSAFEKHNIASSLLKVLFLVHSTFGSKSCDVL